MKRDLNRIQNETYDVVVVGGGMQGACVAHEAASRNLKTCLIEANDFASGASYNSLKIIHGGLRYLQTFDLIRMRDSIRERRALLRIAPHLVHPLECMMPTEPLPRLRSLAGMAAALTANGIMSCDRNLGLSCDHTIGLGRLLSKNQMREIFGENIMPGDMTGGAVWYDAMVHNAERLVLSFISTACSRYGMDAANYCKATGFTVSNGRVTEIKATDANTGSAVCIKTKAVINCAGAWIEKLLDGANIKHPNLFTPCRVMNVLTRKKLFPVDKAIGSFKGGRTFFFVPWRNYWMIGSNEKNWEGDPDDIKVTEPEIEEFLRDINAISPSIKLSLADICFVHKGLLPSKNSKPNRQRSPGDKYRIYEHADALNMLTVIPVKYTTGRGVAEKTIDRLTEKLGMAHVRTVSYDTLLDGAMPGLFSDYLKRESDTMMKKYGINCKIAEHLIRTYGTEYPAVIARSNGDKSLLECIPGSDECIKAEILHAVDSEMAITAEDILMRRTDIASGEKPKPDTVAFVEKMIKRI